MKPMRRAGMAGVVLLSLSTLLWGRAAAGGEDAPASATNSQPTNAASTEPGDPLVRLCELGITYALSGETTAAESVFVSLLSRSPGDARALNNLGNLNLRRGDVGLALAFYARAGRADSSDAGIILNEATALMVGGDDGAAGARASEGIRRAGGTEQAARLLGLRYTGTDDAGAPAAEHTQLSRDEVLAMLRAATGAVPADSTKAKAATASTKTRTQKPIPAWRSAGARGAADMDVTAVVYWKR